MGMVKENHGSGFDVFIPYLKSFFVKFCTLFGESGFKIIRINHSKQKGEPHMDIGSILTWILVGGVAGFLADLVIKGIRMGLLGKIIVGILGGFLGGWLFSLLGISIGGTILSNILTAFVGAVILLIILRALRRR